jgi:hypothetical protein
MRQYSTPTLKFHLKGDGLEEVLAGTGVLTFGKLNKETNAFEQNFDATYTVEKINGQTYIYTTLTQEQTASFDANTNAYVQFRSTKDGNSYVSTITPVRVLPTIKNEVL